MHALGEVGELELGVGQRLDVQHAGPATRDRVAPGVEVHRVDDSPTHDWYDLFELKNELFGEDRAALEALAVGRTSWGTRSYAVGQNPTAASVAGVSVWRHVLTSYLLSGLLAGIAGLLLAALLVLLDPVLPFPVAVSAIILALVVVVLVVRAPEEAHEHGRMEG